MWVGLPDHEVICSGAIEYIVQETKSCKWGSIYRKVIGRHPIPGPAWNPYFGDVTAEKVKTLRKWIHFYARIKKIMPLPIRFGSEGRDLLPINSVGVNGRMNTY